MREALVRIGKRVTHSIRQFARRRTIKETAKVTPDRLGSDLAATAEATVGQLAVRRRKQVA